MHCFFSQQKSCMKPWYVNVNVYMCTYVCICVCACVCVCVHYTSKKVSVLLSTVEYSNSTFCNINSHMYSMCMCMCTVRMYMCTVFSRLNASPNNRRSRLQAGGIYIEIANKLRDSN